MNSYLHVKLRILSIISTVFVVFVHSHNLLLVMSEEAIISSSGLVGFIENFISQGITRVASPLFFLISGYLFFLNLKETSGWFLAKVRKRLKTLLVPYLLWSLWGILFFLLLQNLPFTRSFFTNELIADYQPEKLLKTFLIDPIPYQLWFVRDLMMLIIISPLIYYSVKYLKIYAIGIYLMTWFLQVEFFIFDSRSLFFFAAGLYFALNTDLLTDKNYSRYAYLFLFLWLSFSFVKSVLVFNGIEESLYGLVHKLSVLFGVIALWSIYDKLFQNSDLTKLRIFPFFHFSFFIYTSHEPFLTIAKKGLLATLGHSNPAVLISYFTAPAITILFCVLLGYLLKRKLPGFYDIISGGR